MRHALLILTALATLLVGVAPAAAQLGPSDELLAVALQAKAHGAERAAQALAAAPGQQDKDTLERRTAHFAEKLARFADHPGQGKGLERAMSVHAILAEGCTNPGRGDGEKRGHSKVNHKFATCLAADALWEPGAKGNAEDPDD